MNFEQSSLMAVACLLLAVGYANGSAVLLDTDASLMSFMSRSNDLLKQNPARSMECFNYYIPLINQLAEGYELNYQRCLNRSEEARANADNATWDKRNELENAASSSCDLLAKCGYSESVSEVFQCYIDGGSANINIMYLINANASEQLVNLREQYYLIENNEFRCTNDTKRAYEKESAEAYANLNSCISGNSPVPTAAPSTSTTTTETTSTTSDPTSTSSEAPSTPSTIEQDPSTEAAESSEAPAS